MIGPHRIEGYAIVSADGMIADADGDDAGYNSQRCRPKIFAGRDGSRRRGRARTPLARGRSARGAAQAHHRDAAIAAVAPDRSHPNALFGIPPARRSNRRSRRWASATARSPSSAAPKYSACFCRSMTRSISRARPRRYSSRTATVSRRSARIRRRKTCSRATVCAPGLRAISTPPPALRSRHGSVRADDAVRDLANASNRARMTFTAAAFSK